jgi:hypothetical protein
MRKKNLTGIAHLTVPTACYFSKTGTHTIRLAVQAVQYTFDKKNKSSHLVVRCLDIPCAKDIGVARDVIFTLEKVSNIKTCRDPALSALINALRHVLVEVAANKGLLSIPLATDSIPKIRQENRTQSVGTRFDALVSRLDQVWIKLGDCYGLKFASGTIRYSPGLNRIVLHSSIGIIAKYEGKRWVWCLNQAQKYHDFIHELGVKHVCLACDCMCKKSTHSGTRKHFEAVKRTTIDMLNMIFPIIQQERGCEPGPLFSIGGKSIFLSQGTLFDYRALKDSINKKVRDILIASTVPKT